METQLQIFKNPDFGDMRTIIRDGERFRLDELQFIANVLNISISRLLGEEQE